MLLIVHISMGVGKSIIGANSVMPPAAKLAIPREVNANSVGNSLGCMIHKAVKLKTFPIRAAKTKAGRVHVGSLGSTKNTMARPEKT